ncbi:type 1 glutamine amidotransferase domain-containing protein [Acidicapsa ligni]|uniref:type 1 glutamine amidotransferase domain-containing protein n=1 Tax=Acidicapsa ligni TaxID=542300 RepID=UPI0021DF6B27|nr:type 1 glutamine amidotransferase domain-containing protein [Acidicapsa ligni]
MNVLFIITGSDQGTWLSEVTHPYWHLIEHGIEIDFATPEGGRVVWDPLSHPATQGSHEPNDLVTKGFFSDGRFASKLAETTKLSTVDLDRYAAVHVAGGLGAVYDLYPNEDVARTLEYFWAHDKVIGAICHGSIALVNNPERIRGRHVTGYTRAEDRELEERLGSGFFIPHFPQPVLEGVEAVFDGVEPGGSRVVLDQKLVTGQNQFSASEYGIVLYRAITGADPVLSFGTINSTP